MSHRLLLIEQGVPSAEADIGGMLASAKGLLWERDTWDSFQPDSLRKSSAQLVVSVAVPLLQPALGFFQWLQTHPISTPTLAVLPAETDEEILRTVSEVADDFILCPIHREELLYRLRRILGRNTSEVEAVHDRLAQTMGLGQLVGADPAFVRSIETIPLIAKSGAPVLITGQTGTGKELCARTIHYLSKRRHFPFIAVDCSAIPDHLFENELFGHARGAYTDAYSDQKGLAAMAEGGTLFLDEIDALSTAAQAKLLRFIQERTYKPLGAERFVHANVNVLAATNTEIESSVRQKLFRADLYFRLNVLRLHLPPLQKRRQDIELLARHFLKSLSSSGEHVGKSLSVSALHKLILYDWPGNVRELLNVVHRAALLSEGTQILPRHISFTPSVTTCETASRDFRKSKEAVIETFERAYLEDLLGRHRGNVTRAAQDAGKDRRALGRLIKKYGIDRRSLG